MLIDDDICMLEKGILKMMIICLFYCMFSDLMVCFNFDLNLI